MSSTYHRPDVDGGPPPSGWYPPPGWYPAAPVPRRRNRAVVAWTVGGIALAVVLLVVIAVAGFGLGRSMDEMAPAPRAAETTTPVDPSGLGDDPGLDSYAERCHDGEMDACDDLAVLSELMSGYEQYGMTCGGRIKAVEVLTCTQLD